jgi:RNA polymerase sigma factor (sigma-70 family)
MSDDNDLLDKWRGGEEEAGCALFDRYSTGVCRFFRGKVANDEVANDLAQKTFLALVEGRDRIRNDTSVRSYIFGVAHNLFREHLRRAVREPVDGSVTSAHDLGPTASALIGTVQTNRLLLEALRRIPLDLQIIYELRIWEELTVPEIAAIVDAPEGTIKTRLRAGKEKLALEMKRLAASSRGLDSTSTTLDGWAAWVRGLLKRPPSKRKSKRDDDHHPS